MPDEIDCLFGIGFILFIAVIILREITDVDTKITRVLCGISVEARPWSNVSSGAARKAVNFQYLSSF